MSSRLLIGGAAAAAAGYMLYEYQQQNERQRQALIPPTQTRQPVTGVKEQASALGRDIQQSKDDTAKWLKDQKEYGQTKATEMTNELQRNLHEEASRQRRGVNEVVDDATYDVSKGWDRIKEGVAEDTQSIKDALRGVAHKADQTVPNAKQKGREMAEGAKDTSKSIFNYGFGEAERAKAIAIGEYDKANKQFNNLLEQYNESKKGLFDSGDSK